MSPFDDKRDTMNFSFSALSLANVAGSPVLTSPLMQRGQLSLKNAFATRFSTNFLRFSQFSGKAQFSNSRFNSFLRAPLAFNSMEMSKEIIHEFKSIVDPKDSDVKITSCMFQKCRSTLNGGALLVSGQYLTLTIIKSSFLECSTQQGQGGGFYFDGDSMFARNVCFSKCECDTSGQAIDACTNNNNLFIEGCSFDACSTSITETGEETAPIDLLRGKQRLTESNVTGCFVSAIYSGFHTDDSTNLVMRQTTFKGNRGNILIGIEDAKSHDDISFINIIDNKCVEEETYGVLYATNATVISNAVFISNSPLLVQADVFVHFTFNKCAFDADFGNSNVTGQVTAEWNECEKNAEPETYQFSVFDDRYCWQIDPPTLPAGKASYWFFIVFFAFVGIVGYATFLSYKRISSGATTADVNANPLIKGNQEQKYDTTN